MSESSGQNIGEAVANIAGALSPVELKGKGKLAGDVNKVGDVFRKLGGMFGSHRSGPAVDRGNGHAPAEPTPSSLWTEAVSPGTHDYGPNGVSTNGYEAALPIKPPTPPLSAEEAGRLQRERFAETQHRAEAARAENQARRAPAPEPTPVADGATRSRDDAPGELGDMVDRINLQNDNDTRGVQEQADSEARARMESMLASGKNPSVQAAEADVRGHRRMAEANEAADKAAEEARAREAAEAAERARAERESIGRRLAAGDEQESVQDRARRQDQGQVDQAAGREGEAEAARIRAEEAQHVAEQQRQEAAEAAMKRAEWEATWRRIADRLPARPTPEQLREAVVDFGTRYGLSVAIGAGAEVIINMTGVDHNVVLPVLIGGSSAGLAEAASQMRRNWRGAEAAARTEGGERIRDAYQRVADRVFGGAIRDPQDPSVWISQGRFNRVGTEEERRRVIRESLARQFTAGMQANETVRTPADDAAYRAEYQRTMNSLPESMIDAYMQQLDTARRDEQINSYKPRAREVLAEVLNRQDTRGVARRAIVGGLVAGAAHELIHATGADKMIGEAWGKLTGWLRPSPSGGETVPMPHIGGENPAEAVAPVAVPIPEVQNHFAGTPMIDQTFPEVGPEGEDEARFSGWFQAEAVKAWKELVLHQQNPTFDMRGPGDLKLLFAIQHDPRVADLFDPNGTLREQLSQYVMQENLADHRDVSAIVNGTAADGTAVVNDVGFPVGEEYTYRVPDIRAVLKTLL